MDKFVFYIFYSQLACFALEDWQSLQVLPFRHKPPIDSMTLVYAVKRARLDRVKMNLGQALAVPSFESVSPTFPISLPTHHHTQVSPAFNITHQDASVSRIAFFIVCDPVDSSREFLAPSIANERACRLSRLHLLMC